MFNKLPSYQTAHLYASLSFLAASRTVAVANSTILGGWYLGKCGPLLPLVTSFPSWLSLGYQRCISTLHKTDVLLILYKWKCLRHDTLMLWALIMMLVLLRLMQNCAFLIRSSCWVSYFLEGKRAGLGELKQAQKAGWNLFLAIKYI